jgi:hypothetical protein
VPARSAIIAIATAALLGVTLLAACGVGPTPQAGQAGVPSQAADAATPTRSAGQRCVTGVVVSGGDTTPPDLADAPRAFSYVVKADDGSTINLWYTAYPPSADGRQGPRLVFHAGTIVANDYVSACGRFEETTNAIVVAEPGDFIETYPQKPGS